MPEVKKIDIVTGGRREIGRVSGLVSGESAVVGGEALFDPFHGRIGRTVANRRVVTGSGKR